MMRAKSPLSVLVVEDEALLMMDLEAVVEDTGHRVVGGAACWDEVAALADDLSPDLVLLDVQLAHGSSGIDVCLLIRRRWADALVVFVTANPLKIPDDRCGAYGVIAKPFSRSGLMAAMRYIAEGIAAPPPRSLRPAGFQASPALATCWS